MKSLETQKRIAADLMKCSYKKVVFDVNSLNEIKEAITKADIRALISKGIISKRTNMKGHSRVRARIILRQKRKGLRKGHGSREGSANARSNKKEEWINRIRKIREFLKKLKDKKRITTQNYWILYNKAKGGFFRSLRHIKIYLEEHDLFIKK